MRRLGLLEKAPSPPWRTLATPPAQPSLAAPGKLFTLRFSQVATNYTLVAFPGAPCKAPEPDVPEFRMLRATATGLAICPLSTWLPCAHLAALDTSASSDTMALCCFVLLPPCSSPPSFLQGLFPAQPCTAWLLSDLVRNKYINS